MIFSKEQLMFLTSINIHVESNNTISDDELFLIEEKVSHLLQTEGFDKGCRPTEIGIM